MNHRSLLCLVAALSWVQCVRAEVVSPNAFHYRGGAPTFLTSGEVAGSWNVTDPSFALSPGLKVMFFGHAASCSVDSNGPVSDKGNPRIAQAQSLTGIAPDLSKGRSWSPSGDTDKCDAAVRGKAGDSFAIVNPDPIKGGIGLFTYTGRDETNREPFFQQYSEGGKGNTGANASISGTFFVWSLKWRDKEVVAPWGRSGGGADPVAELRTVQSVERAVIPGEAGGRRGVKAAQAKQQVVFTLFNADCMREGGSNPRGCRMKYLFNTAVYRGGVEQRDAGWFSRAGVFFDPAQGGAAIVHGQIPPSGRSGEDKHSGRTVFTSAGVATQTENFSQPKTFRVRISFSQFKDALRSITSQKLHKPFNGVSDADIAETFGKQWSDPQQWVLSSINVAQEVFNPVRDKRAFIGGSVRELYLGP